MKLKIIERNQSDCCAFHLFIRQIIMILFVEVSLYSIGGIFINCVVRLSQVDIFLSFVDISNWITFLSVVMILLTKTHISLHDYFSYTTVVEIKS